MTTTTLAAQVRALLDAQPIGPVCRQLAVYCREQANQYAINGMVPIATEWNRAALCLEDAAEALWRNRRRHRHE